MSQSLKGYYVENGSFYIFYKKKFLKFKNRLHGKIGVYEMPAESIHEIDTKEDLRIVKKLLKNQNQNRIMQYILITINKH